MEKETRMYVAANSKIRKLANNVYLVPKASYKNFYVNDLLGRNIPLKITGAGKDFLRIELKNMAMGRFFLKRN
ncbi:MAG TPA: hypothetical protein VHO70_14985 [Chitinispirillaceae bacterium]|nr:hypothetical protein [Chitinispirillaceae bacterium]